MVVSTITTKMLKHCAELSGLAITEKKPKRKFRIWWRIPLEYAVDLPASGDPFLAALLPLCMLKGERLKIEAPVSPQLLETTHEIQSIYHSWLSKSIIIPIETLPGSDPKTGSYTGCFFSGGVDSFYTLLKNHDLDQKDLDRITHLLFIAGFDIALHKKALLRQTRTSLQQVATGTGCQLVEVQSNLRKLSDSILTWEFYHGAAMASAALACGPLFRKMIISSSFCNGHLQPWGSHPQLDPLWSTETTAFVHRGCEISRVEKIVSRICQSDLALRHLRVCWKNYGRQYNCGFCEKCVRTMISLYVGTGKRSFPTFSKPLTEKTVRHLHLSSKTIHLAEENERLLSSNPACDPKMAAALQAAIQDYQQKPTTKGETQ